MDLKDPFSKKQRGDTSMKTTITGRKVTLKDSFKERVQKKLTKFDRFFDDSAEAFVTVHVEQGRQTVEITIRDAGGMIYRAEETAVDMVDALESVCDVLFRQICSNKNRLERHLRSGAFNDIDDAGVDDDGFKVVKTKNFSIKPMSVDEAILQMNLLGHMFFLFYDVDTDVASVVYRRKDGNYGLIEASMD